MPSDMRNLVLVGMPGAGKSTVGVILAKWSQRQFVDTDLLIQTDQHRSLQQIVDSDGHQILRAIEERVILEMKVRESVVATGGSVVYSPAAMEHLQRNGVVIYLDTSLPELTTRVTNYETRGIAREPGQTLEELFRERNSLYEQYADWTIACDHCTPEEVCEQILSRLNEAV
ncbi:MAG: shikimate kinase [Rubinisphaera brasiliensis]|uniref:Shikimate kinase n=1 Tax=Rubinisphaera brasiliensis (strain ATCC 49424 / DSM 5305 / JCM 21570 / IAM 15109 / NBRC 103401 / IFAM 1448) TaxID=756272 RepID=F0SS85_RUBBR|nr:shikimate kinase [Rubinisphaera brasiliensis]ADY58096.1 shikimate kinase [Rubinisphaera brasiliensis DSM 5305]